MRLSARDRPDRPRCGRRRHEPASGVAAESAEPAAPEFFFAGDDWFVRSILCSTRGLGQSALSVVSLALVGQAWPEATGVAIGVYSFLVGLGFMAAFAGVKAAFETVHADWRALWAGDRVAVLIAFGVVALVFVRDRGRRKRLRGSPRTTDRTPVNAATLGEALRIARLLGVRPGDLVLRDWSPPACRCSTSRSWPNAASTAACS